MKRITLLLLPLMAILVASCSDDDKPSENKAKTVEGQYKGYAVASSKYFQDMTADDQTVTITALDNATVSVSYVSDTWGSFSIPSATVVSSGDTYLIKGQGKTSMGMDGNVKEYTCTFEGSTNADKSSVEFKFSVPSVMGGLEMVFKTGAMPQQ